MKKDLTVGEIVAQDFRAASVFKEAGIDFCCGGKKSVAESCSEKGLDKELLLSKLELLKSSTVNKSQNFIEWSPVFLCDYIVNTHHKFVLKALPDLVQYTQKLADVHGSNHPELIEVADLFKQIDKELLQHLKNEEEVFFPSIKTFLAKGSIESQIVVKSEMSRLKEEHEFAGGAMDKINVITNNYKVPADGCNTYKVGFKMLEEFEDDLHVHVHLENNVLFPKVNELIK